MDKEYLTVKEIWDFIDKIKPGAIRKTGNKYSPEALECLFFVTESQGKRLNDKSITIPRANEWQRNRKRLVDECEADFANKRRQIAGNKKGNLSKDEIDRTIKEKCEDCCKREFERCGLYECCIHSEEEPRNSFREQLTWVLAQAIELRDLSLDNRSEKDIILEFLNEKKFQKASGKIQKSDDGDFEKMAKILVGLVNWKESHEDSKSLQKIKIDFQQQKKQLLQLRDKFESLGRKYSDQWWREIAEILVSTPSEYDDDDLDIREKKAQDAAENGNYRRANLILSNPTWKNEVTLMEKILEEGRARCRRYISGQRCLIRNLCISSPPKDEVIKIYEEITHLSEEYQIEYHILREYSEFLYSQKEYDKGIEIAKRLDYHYKMHKNTLDAEKAKLYILLGNLYYANDEFKESIRFCKDANKILEKDPYRYIKERAKLYVTMSDIYWKTIQSDQAKYYGKRALELLERCDELTDDESLFRANAYKRLGTLMNREWNLDEAEKYYKEALGIQEELYKKDPIHDKFAQDLAATYSNLGIIYRRMKKYDEGERYYQKSNDIREKKYRDSDDLNFNWAFAITSTNYAYLLACAGKQAEAETKMEEIVFPIKGKLVEKYPDSKKYLSSYAYSLKDYGFILSCSDSNDDEKWERASEKFLESIDLVKHLTKNSKLSKEYEDLMATINFEYGCLLKKMGKDSEAIIRLREALVSYQDLNGNSSYYIHDIEIAVLELAELLSKSKGTWTEAEIAYQLALDFGEKLPETSHKYHQDDYERILKGLISILQLQNRPEDQLKIKNLKEKLATYETKNL